MSLRKQRQFELQVKIVCVWDDESSGVCVSVVTACSAGRYGPDCSQTVLCGEGAQSDPVSGRCACVPGRRGEDCGQGEVAAGSSSTVRRKT